MYCHRCYVTLTLWLQSGKNNTRNISSVYATVPLDGAISLLFIQLDMLLIIYGYRKWVDTVFHLVQFSPFQKVPPTNCPPKPSINILMNDGNWAKAGEIHTS